MICTNPDLIVDRGEVLENCVQVLVAMVFEKMGGEVMYILENLIQRFTINLLIIMVRKF